jgi:hypothetical protein
MWLKSRRPDPVRSCLGLWCLCLVRKWIAVWGTWWWRRWGLKILPYPLLPPETRGSRLPFSVCPFQVDYHLCRCSWESRRMDWFRRFCEPNSDPCISSRIRLRLQLWLWTLHWWQRERWWWGKCLCVPLHPLSFVPCDCSLGWPTSPAWLSLGWNLPDDIFSLGELLPPGMVTSQRLLHRCSNGLLPFPGLPLCSGLDGVTLQSCQNHCHGYLWQSG